MNIIMIIILNLGCTWFLEITFIQEVKVSVSVCVCECVCVCGVCVCV